MILPGSTIKDKIYLNEIGCDPTPDEIQYQPASLDVRLGETLYHIEDDKEVTSRKHSLQPRKRYLGHTVEEISLPTNIAAQLAGRSSVGRKGVIVHKTAGWIDPGFCGDLTLELMNFGEQSVEFEIGERVAQLVFLMMLTPSSGYDGKYQGQKGPTKVK